MEWNKTREVGVPKPKFETKGKLRTMTISVELLVSDTKSVWNETYYFEEDYSHFIQNITHWIEVDKITAPKY